MVKMFCPQCGARHAPGAAVCVACGTSLQTGRRLVTRGETGEEDGAEAFYIRLIQPFAEHFPGLFRVRVLIPSIILGVVALVLAGLCVVFIAMHIVLVALMAGAVGFIAYASAVAWIQTGEVAMLSTSLSDFNGGQWLLFLALMGLPFVLVGLAFKFYVPAG